MKIQGYRLYTAAAEHAFTQKISTKARQKKKHLDINIYTM